MELDEEYETKQQAIGSYKRDNPSKPSNWRNSLTHLKSSLRSDRRNSKESRRRDEDDEEPIKTHRPFEHEKQKASNSKTSLKIILF